jgi:hypothetical protein
MASNPQNLQNHARYVPLYHFLTLGILVVLMVHSIKRTLTQPSLDAAFDVALDAALILVAFYARSFALTVQDRVIRLELKLRMQAIAPQQAARFSEFKPSQLVALRFAGDTELPGLAQQVLDGKLTGSPQIKRQIKDWQADDLRA